MAGGYSVVIPAWNAQATIGEALASVMAQTLPPEAIFVVDDGSTDATADTARAACPQATVIAKQNGGPGSATWAGMLAATSGYVATLDADDIWLPEKMARQINRLDAEPAVAAVFSLAKMFADGADPDSGAPGPEIRLWTRTTMVYRTAAAREIGAMRDFPGYLGELVDWLGRGRELGHNHLMIEEVLAMRRRRAGSLSDKASRERLRGYLHAARDAIRRRKDRAV